MKFITNPRWEREEKYGPLNPGPLHVVPASGMNKDDLKHFNENCLHGIHRKSVAQTFRTETYSRVFPAKNIHLILIRDQNSKEGDSMGSFFAFDHERARDVSQEKGDDHSIRHDYSIPSEWNSLLSSQIVIVPHEFCVWKGTTAPLSHASDMKKSYPGGGEQIFIDRETAKILWEATQKWLEGDRSVFSLDPALVEKAKASQKAFLEKVERFLSTIRAEKSKEVAADKEFEKEREKYAKASGNVKNIGRSRIQNIHEGVEGKLISLIRRMRSDPILKNSVVLSRARALLKEVRAAMKKNNHLILLHEGPNSKWRQDCNARTSQLMTKGNRIARLPPHIREFLGHKQISSEKKLPSGWITIHTEEIEGVNRRLRVRFEWSHDETIIGPDGKSKTIIHWYNVFYEWS